MPRGELTALQQRILAALAKLPVAWTLTGGAALVGFHLHHRTTRDLDLLWRDRGELGTLPTDVATALRAAEVDVVSIQSTPALHRLRASGGDDVCIVDLIAEPIPAVDHPSQFTIAGAVVLVDTPLEILVDKLCALLGRSELRDLVDTSALLASGVDLERALRLAPRKDSAFSALSLAWVLRNLDVAVLARAAGLDREEQDALATFQASLIERLLSLSTPRG